MKKIGISNLQEFGIDEKFTLISQKNVSFIKAV
jgi:hypothetical protein